MAQVRSIGFVPLGHPREGLLGGEAGLAVPEPFGTNFQWAIAKDAESVFHVASQVAYQTRLGNQAVSLTQFVAHSLVCVQVNFISQMGNLLWVDPAFFAVLPETLSGAHNFPAR